MKKINITFLLLLIIGSLFSQNKEEISKIISTYDLVKLKAIERNLNLKYVKESENTIKMAKIFNLPLTISEKGVYKRLKKVLKDGTPIYIQTLNTSAATSSRASFLHNNGGMGLNIEGQGMNVFLWDGGHALANHNEFMVSGTSKIIPADTNAETDPQGLNHATHTMGTIIAKGFTADAKGMAPQASGYAFDWNNDLAEAASAVAFGMLISNHSYGPILSFLPDWAIGAYNSESAAWDDLLFNSPYYLACAAAGNDGFDNTSNSVPNGGNAAYDKLSYMTTAKNVMVVANAQDAAIDANGVLIFAQISSGSSQGPTDDYRIKPDIAGNGVSVYSPIHSSVVSYDSYNGTSMASPNVAGSLLLLQQLYNQENGNFMLSASLKGLALHTADDRGNFGPDASFGWGYMNSKKAAEVILSNDELITELTLNNNESFTFNVTSSGLEVLKASISWTDAASTNINNGVTNDHTPVLVNDLDIRITESANTFLPWKLTGVNSTLKGDNIVDPFERIDVDNPGIKLYTITISHKGTLNTGLQNYTVIVTGITSSSLSLNKEEISGYKLYPNPPRDGFVNVIMNQISNYSLIVTNALGKTVFKQNFKNTNSTQINLNHLKTGIYYVTTTNTNTNTKKIKKLIIN